MRKICSNQEYEEAFTAKGTFEMNHKRSLKAGWLRWKRLDLKGDMMVLMVIYPNLWAFQMAQG